MKVLSFHLKGKMGHFRKYYSNSSSLTYSVPPRTTICGILAGVLGRDRDSYYEELSLENCDIAIALRSPLKKQIHTLNLLKVEVDNDLNGSKGITQTPTEMILPMNIRTDNLHYQIWVRHKNNNIMEALHKILGHVEFGYGSTFMPISLGTAYNLGWLEYDGLVEGITRYSEEPVEIDSVLPISCIKTLCFNSIADKGYRLIREELPMEFDKDRRLTPQGMGDVVINLTALRTKAQVKEHVELTGNQRIIWLR